MRSLAAGLLLAGCASMPAGDGMKAYELSLASGAGLAMAWHGGPGVLNMIYVQPLDASAKPQGAPYKLTEGSKDAYEPDLQFIDGDPLIAWYEKDKRTGFTDAWLARLDRQGRTIWKAALSASGGKARNPVVRLAGGVIHVAWIETSEGSPSVFTQTFDAQGQPKSAPLRAGTANTTTWNVNATTDVDGVFYVTYDAQLGTRAHELQLLAIKGSSVTNLTISSDDGHASLYPDLGISAQGEAALAWFDEKDGNQEVYLSVQPIADLLAGRTHAPQRITHTAAASIGAYLAWNADRLALVWCDSEEGQSELYAETFDRSGRPLSQIQRLTHTPEQSSIPSVRAWKRGFAVAWNEYASNGAGDGQGHASITASHASTRLLP